MEKIAVIGAGTIGASWAAYFLARGFEVVASDPAADGEARARKNIATAWPVLEKLGNITPGASPDALRFESDPIKAVAGAEFVQESGPEREDLKIALFEQLDAVLPPESIIASSSSGLLATRLQSRCKHPQRCIVGHPFNPPHIIPLVEVVGGEQTSPEVIARAMDFYRRIGKHPIYVRKEVLGHVANRLQAAMWREAVHLVLEGVTRVTDVDAAITYGPGLRWAVFGPHLTLHLGGGAGGMQHFLNQLLGPFINWWNDLGHPQMTPENQRRLIAGVEREAAGRSVAELTKERDRCLIAVIKALKQAHREQEAEPVGKGQV